MESIYTREEVIAKIKAIDTKLEDALEESSIDSMQNRSTYEIDVAELRRQRDYYRLELQAIDRRRNKTGLITLVRAPRGWRP